MKRCATDRNPGTSAGGKWDQITRGNGRDGHDGRDDHDGRDGRARIYPRRPQRAPNYRVRYERYERYVRYVRYVRIRRWRSIANGWSGAYRYGLRITNGLFGREWMVGRTGTDWVRRMAVRLRMDGRARIGTDCV